jgi:RND family efflux transporter MFP subunit
MLLSGLAAAALLVLAGCGSSSSASGAQPKAANPEVEARKVQAVPVRAGAINRTVEVNGTLAAQDDVILAFKVAGRIESLSVDLGDSVREGQVLASLDKTDFRLAVQQAEAALQQARARLGLAADSDNEEIDLERTSLVQQARASLEDSRLARDRAKEMLDARLIARADYDTAEANYQIADGRYQDAVEEVRNRQATLLQRKTELELARQMLSDAELRAPISGAILERTASQGQYVAPGTSVVRLVRMKPLRLQLPVPERAATGVQIGQEIRLSLEGDSNDYRGFVSRLSPAIDPMNRTLLVEATIPNEAGRLKPGTFVRASLVTRQAEDTLFIPAQALVVFAGIEKAFVVVDGRSAEKLIRTGRRNADEVEVLEGLNAGERVVVEPGSLVGGMRVEIAAE